MGGEKCTNHRHPVIPATPFICKMAKERRPPKAPERAAEPREIHTFSNCSRYYNALHDIPKRKAILSAISSLLYQFNKNKLRQGNKHPSAAPSRRRVRRRVE